MNSDAPKTTPANLSSASPEATEKDLHTTLAALEELEGAYIARISNDQEGNEWGWKHNEGGFFTQIILTPTTDLSQWIRKLEAERDALIAAMRLNGIDWEVWGNPAVVLGSFLKMQKAHEDAQDDRLAAQAAEIEQLRKDRERLEYVIETGMWILQSNVGGWSIFVPGDQGEPDWKEIATGDTPREAIDAARLPKTDLDGSPKENG